MHWIDRGPEPNGLEAIRDRYTLGWVDFYEHGTGSRPTDSRWREFRAELGQRFRMQCGYCEIIYAGDVDHFRPKSKFPELVYVWDNWVFACSVCNQKNKREKWPAIGYVDPCAMPESCRPEAYFTFDTKTGEIIPLDGLDQNRFEKAITMIDDLDLNSDYHLKRRAALLGKLAAGIPTDPREASERSEALRGRFASRDSDLSSLARAWLTERGYEISD